MSTNVKLGVRNDQVKQVGINWTNEELNEALNVFGNIEMNHFLVQGFVEAITNGNFNNYTKGGIYLFSNTPSNAPCAKGILEVIPSATSVVQRVTAIGASDEAVTGAIFLRSAHKVGSAWSWDADWITVSTSGGTITIIDTVTQGSSNPVTSNGIYNFVQSAIIAPHDPYAEIYITCSDGTLSAAPVLKFQGWTNSVPSTVTELVTDTDFKTTLKNVVHIYINNVFCGEGLLFAEEGISQSETATVSTEEVQVYFPSTVPFTQNNSTTYYEGVSGKLTYSSSDWHLGGYQASGNISSFIAPDWSGILMQANAYTDLATRYTNPNGTTMTVGGIEKGTNFDNVPLTTIIHDLLYPYVPPTFSSFSTNIDISNGKKYEIYSSQSLTYVKPVYTPGSESLTSIKVGTSSGGSQIAQSSTVPASNTNFTFTAYNNVSRTTKGNFVIYVTLDDGTNKTGHAPVRSINIPFTPFYYYALSQNGTTIPNSPTGISNGVESVTVTTVYGDYLYLYSPETGKTKIQQYSMNMWNDVPTTNMGTKSLNINGTSMTYYVFRTPALVAGSGQFRVV